MDYTEINSCIHRVNSSLASAAQDLQRANVRYGGMVVLVESQMKLMQAMCKQMEELSNRVKQLENNVAS